MSIKFEAKLGSHPPFPSFFWEGISNVVTLGEYYSLAPHLWNFYGFFFGETFFMSMTLYVTGKIVWLSWLGFLPHEFAINCSPTQVDVWTRKRLYISGTPFFNDNSIQSDFWTHVLSKLRRQNNSKWGTPLPVALLCNREKLTGFWLSSLCRHDYMIMKLSRELRMRITPPQILANKPGF